MEKKAQKDKQCEQAVYQVSKHSRTVQWYMRNKMRMGDTTLRQSGKKAQWLPPPLRNKQFELFKVVSKTCNIDINEWILKCKAL